MPLNLRVGGVELPIGLGLVFLVLLATALLNLLTKEVATIGGSAFTLVFLCLFMVSERLHERRRGGAAHRHVEQFNQASADEIDPRVLGIDKPYRKLVAIRSTNNLFMLEKTLSETDPDDHRRGRNDRPGCAAGRYRGHRAQPGRLRPHPHDGRGGPRREGRKTRPAASSCGPTTPCSPSSTPPRTWPCRS